MYCILSILLCMCCMCPDFCHAISRPVLEGIFVIRFIKVSHKAEGSSDCSSIKSTMVTLRDILLLAIQVVQ